MAVSPVSPKVCRRARWYRWLLALPFVWQLGLAPAVNEVRLAPWGLPFPMLWQMLGVVFTSVVIATVFGMDRRRGAHTEESVEEPSAVPNESGDRR